jgi:hypothetical protein
MRLISPSTGLPTNRSRTHNDGRKHATGKKTKPIAPNLNGGFNRVTCSRFAPGEIVEVIMPVKQLSPLSFRCAICNATVYQAIPLDPWPMCQMCRWLCAASGAISLRRNRS